MSKPARLGKCNAHEILEKELRITGRSLLFIAFLVILFFIVVSIVMQPVTLA